ncbi:periplasmic binding protein/LacI transcriptional regulator [Candidatus Moduliflexus flocculans]|uniref:Periplasmic binding protein/LacI transcriptional regulator n=1 Tax=Candidatus Moduliflexus flocculans TaxID=1499966 RepID=A0A081BSR2_9BACT|nr:periplasmic binding protein/LacI transcriptional regulator [Candidatus Moduliflexus flocculans]
MLKKLLSLGLIVVVVMLAVNLAFAADKKLVIFSQCNFGEPYRAAQNKLMQELWAKEPDVEFQIFDGQADAAKQISQIENAIRQEPDLLIVAPLQRDSLTKVMGEAVKAGIPTICLERDLVEPNWTTYIRSDNRKIGQQAGQYVVDFLTQKNGAPKGNVVEIQGMKGVEGALNRHAGFWDIVSKYPDIKLVHDATANWFQPEAIDRMTEALNAVPEIDVVYAHNDPMAYGAYLAAKEKGREKEMIFIGIDGLVDEGQKYVKEGILAVTFVYPLCVDKAVEIGKQILADPNFKPEPTYLMESSMVTLETLQGK